MTVPLTVLTYHYVRPIASSAWPHIKGLELEEFRGQLDYIDRHYSPVSLSKILAFARGDPVDWPENPILLTFDDGYTDHHDHAFPELQRRNIPGCFFASTRSLLDRQILDVNKVHFVLASCGDHAALADRLDQAIRSHEGPEEIELLRSQYFKASRWDPAETVYIKRVLQRGLSPAMRSSIAEQLFCSFVSVDPADFAENLYLTVNQAREMIDAGMSFGCHGDDHIWLGHSSTIEQRHDISRSMKLSAALGIKPKDTAFCYPYGSYNSATLDILRSFNCAVGFTTRLDINRMEAGSQMLELARIDAGADLPRSGNAPLSPWTERALSQRSGQTFR
jgi:peptidoglycan/xylan/chitin deacetylase (PgdA/CDA1 family)